MGSDMSSDVDSDTDSDPRKILTSDSDSDTDTRFLRTSDTDSDMDTDKVMTSDTDTTSDTGMSENLGHGLGHGQTSDTRVRSSLSHILFSHIFETGGRSGVFKNFVIAIGFNRFVEINFKFSSLPAVFCNTSSGMSEFSFLSSCLLLFIPRFFTMF